jgi:glutathione S-transferase
MRYMADVTDSSFYPKSAYERAVVEQWMDYFSFQPSRWCTAVWNQNFISPKYFNESPDQKLVLENTTSLLEVMPVIDKHLGSKHWIAGENVSLADINAYILMAGYKDAGLNLNDFRSFMRWFNEYSARPAVKKIEKWI